MKQGLNPRRSRGRSNGRGRNPNVRTQQFDSSGPEGRIRGTASQVYERYLAQARDALSSGDTIAAENLFQHAEHYFRIVNAQNANNPQPQAGRRDGEPGRDRDGGRDDAGPDDDERDDSDSSASTRDDDGRRRDDDDREDYRTAHHGRPAHDRRRYADERPDADELPRFITEREPAAADAFQDDGGRASQGLFSDLDGDGDPPSRRERPHREPAAESGADASAEEPETPRAPRRLNGHGRGRRRVPRSGSDEGTSNEETTRGPADAEV